MVDVAVYEAKSEMYRIFLYVIVAYNLAYVMLLLFFYCAHVKNKEKIMAIAVECNHSALVDELKINNLVQSEGQVSS